MTTTEIAEFLEFHHPGALGALTGTDWDALRAAAAIVALWSRGQSAAVATAFARVVEQMQPRNSWLAYDLIAAVADWPHRKQLWTQAGLAPPSGPVVVRPW